MRRFSPSCPVGHHRPRRIKKGVRIPMKVQKLMVEFAEIARFAGFTPGPDGKLSLPPNDETLAAFDRAVNDLYGRWRPGDDSIDLTITGAGPVVVYLRIAHSLHGRVARLTYASPGWTAVVWNHGLPD